MGMLVEGKWQDVWYETGSSGGNYIREDAQFRNWISADGAPGPTGEGGFAAEHGRYHLYVSLACPWAHRTLIMRGLKGLEDVISVSVVSPLMLEQGWRERGRSGSDFRRSSACVDRSPAERRSAGLVRPGTPER